MSPKQQFTAQVTTLQRVADRLLCVMTEEAVKSQLRLARRDLDEAADWMQRYEDFDGRPSIMHIVEAILTLASARIDRVNWALKAHGERAAFIE